MRHWIDIGIPYITENGDNASLCADIKYEDGSTKTMYFEVDKKYRSFLCTETIDAFVIGLLYYCICNGYNIKSKAYMNSQLYYQINTYVLPVLQQIDNNEYHMIDIDIPYKKVYFEDAKGVGSSVSGGVDSFYTIVKHADHKMEEYKLTHLVLANLFNKYESEESNRRRYYNLVKVNKKISDELGLELVSIYTNHHDFMYNHFISLYSFRICSYAYALQKLFRTYYVSAGVMIKDTNFFNIDSDDYDIFNLSMANTDTLHFYSSGGEALRTEKLSMISKSDVVRKNLHVCTFYDDKNCSECNKCLRTMLSLDIIGKLSEFETCFDIKKFMQKKRSIVRSIYTEDWHLYQDLIDSAKKYNYRFPIGDRFIGKYIKKPLRTVRNIIKKNKHLKKIYYKYRIDYMVHGKERAEVFRFGRNDIPE